MVESIAMDHFNEFRKPLMQIINEDPEPTLGPEEIAFEVQVMKALELVGDWVIWLN